MATLSPNFTGTTRTKIQSKNGIYNASPAVYDDGTMKHCLWVLLIFASFIAQAQEESPNYHGFKAGPLLGLSVPTHNGVNARLLWGSVFDYRLAATAPIGLGLYIVGANGKGDAPNNERFDFNFIFYGGRVLVHLPCESNQDIYFGGMLGTGDLIIKNLTRPKNHFTPYHVGIVAGFDYRIRPPLSVGIEGHAFGVTAVEDTLSSDRNDPFAVFDLAVTSKFWF